MRKYFLFILIIISTCASFDVFAQDIITTKTGEEIKARLLKLTRRTATYKTYDDPEFSTYTLPYKELASIKKEGQKKAILFNHHLPRGYISFGLWPPGGSIPLGSFSKQNFNSTGEPGFAKTGFNLKIDAAFYILKRLGITMFFGFADNRYNYGNYANAFSGQSNSNFSNGGYFNSYSQGYNYYNQGSSNNNYNGKSSESLNNWTFKSYLIGPIYSIKLLKRLTWDLKVRGGSIETNKPNVVLSYFPPQGSSGYYSSYEYQQTTKKAFGYNFGTALRFALSRRIAFFGSADVMHTQPTMDVNVVTTTFSNNNNIQTSAQTSTVQYKLTSLNVVVGFAYQFKRKGNKYE